MELAQQNITVQLAGTNFKYSSSMFLKKNTLSYYLKHFLKNIIYAITKYITRNYNYGHNILRIFDFHQIFFAPQVKQSMIISNKLVYTSCRRLKT